VRSLRGSSSSSPAGDRGSRSSQSRQRAQRAQGQGQGQGQGGQGQSQSQSLSLRSRLCGCPQLGKYSTGARSLCGGTGFKTNTFGFLLSERHQMATDFGTSCSGVFTELTAVLALFILTGDW